MSRVADKVVLVTGAGSGIGRASAKLLAAEGATVIVTDVDRAGGLETVQQIASLNSGGGARFEEQDTAKEADWRRIIDDIMAREGRLNGLVNNAGIAGPFPSSFEGESLDQWRRILSINVEGVFLGCKYGVPALRASGGGSIVNMSSLAALLGTPDLSAYGASKGAVKLLTEGLYAELQGSSVAVTIVFPGAVGTHISENSGVALPRMKPGVRETKVTSAPDAARAIVDAVEHGTFRVLIGGDARMLDRLSRFSPTRAITTVATRMKALVD